MSRENETAEETQLRQQHEQELTARRRENETTEETQIRQQNNRDTTRRIRENESLETTTLRRQHEQQLHCNRNEAIQEQNVVNITSNPLSNQCTPNNNDDSELIKTVFR